MSGPEERKTQKTPGEVETREPLQGFWCVLDTRVVMCVLAILLLASGRVLCFTALCFSAPQEGGSSVRVSLAPRVADTSVSVDPEKLCLVGQFYV